VPYLISVLAVAAGVMVLLTLLVRLAGSARRLAGAVHRSRAHVADRTGPLAARIAALQGQLGVRSIDPAPAARKETHDGHFVPVGEPRRHNGTIR
jgi:hypothetical protein